MFLLDHALRGRAAALATRTTRDVYRDSIYFFDIGVESSRGEMDGWLNGYTQTVWFFLSLLYSFLFSNVPGYVKDSPAFSLVWSLLDTSTYRTRLDTFLFLSPRLFPSITPSSFLHASPHPLLFPVACDFVPLVSGHSWYSRISRQSGNILSSSRNLTDAQDVMYISTIRADADSKMFCTLKKLYSIINHKRKIRQLRIKNCIQAIYSTLEFVLLSL